MLPQTSHDSHKAVSQEMRDKHHAMILEALNVLKLAIGEQIGDYIGLDVHQVMRRMIELERDEKVYKPLTTGLTSKGRKAMQYAIRTPETIVPKPEKFIPENDKAHEFIDGLIEQGKTRQKLKDNLLDKKLVQPGLFGEEK
jgi:hypothetical protein